LFEPLDILQTTLHYGLHFLAPGVLAWVFFRPRWKRAWLIMLLTMAVDLDHLLAWPEVFVPDRCGIGFHPLHSYPAILAYITALSVPKLRIAATGLLLHMATDFQDCLWMAYAP
jgi:hypothetical protein